MTAHFVEEISLTEVTDSMLAAWQNLQQSAHTANPFLDHWHLPLAIKLLSTDNQQPTLLLLWQDQRRARLDGLLPIVYKSKFLGIFKYAELWTHKYCFLGVPLFRASLCTQISHSLATWLKKSRLSLLRLPDCYESFVVSSDNKITTVFDQTYERACYKIRDSSQVATGLSTKKSKEYRRQRRRLEERGFCYSRVDPEVNTTETSNQFLQLEVSGWKGKAKTAFLQNAAEASYLAQMIDTGSQHHKLNIYQISNNKKTIAMLVTLSGSNSELLFKTSFDEEFASYSPGVLVILGYCDGIKSTPGIDYLDSCADPQNTMINRVWRDRICLGSYQICRTDLFTRSLLTARSIHRRATHYLSVKQQISFA